MKARGLVGQLLRWQIITMSVAWFVLASWLTLTMTRLENGDLDRRMSYFAQILAETAAADPEAPNLGSRLEAVQRVFVTGVIESLENAEHYEASYQVLDRNGRMLFQTPAHLSIPLDIQRGVHETRIDGHGARVARVESADGRVDVILVESLSMRWASILPMLEIIGGGQVLIFAACLAAIGWSARRGLAPLAALTHQVQARQPGDSKPIEAYGAFTEVKPLIQAMNELLERESVRLEQERSFLNDAAHELRTPLAAISAQAHLLAEATTPQMRMLAKSQLQTGLDRAAHLLTQLLSMARVDAVECSMSQVTLDVAEFVRRRAAEFARFARERGVTLAVDGPEFLEFAVDPAGFSSLIDNLIDNAIRYAPQLTGHVLVGYNQADGSLRLDVSDNGPGIAPAFRDRVLERFFRVPGSEPAGSGLGLAIVSRIAQAHAARLILEDGPGSKGLRVIVLFPSFDSRHQSESGQSTHTANACADRPTATP